MSALFNDPYSAPSYGYNSQNPADLQFYSGAQGGGQVYDASLEGNVGSGGVANGAFVGGQIQGKALAPRSRKVMS